MATTRGQVIFKSSRHVTVLVGSERWSCELRGLLRRQGVVVVVGDWVEVDPNGPGLGVVSEVLPRSHSLSRKRRVGGGRELIIAANVDRVIAVFAARQPRLKFGALDRLLIAAEREGLPVSIAINKLDLGLEPEQEERLATYPGLGYPVHFLSATRGEGIEEFHERIRGQVSVVAGPSGVGKSSLLQPLFPGEDIRVGEVSSHNEKGRHTTTATTWYPLPGGGAVVDTPGFREYALWGLEISDVSHLMPDLRRHLEQCRFSDCSHREEPGCGVLKAVESGEISEYRYRSYVGIVGSLQEG